MSKKIRPGGDLPVNILRKAVFVNKNSEQNLRDVIGYILFFCVKFIKFDAPKGFVIDD